ncbi:Tetratricopeptide repeat-containing protein [Microbulbifer donghaiensis]|uniref:histidine kinase n=1 Tax=Microbulbifer donghaiensis TaxID=494016 RepID=A0A1M4XLF6_9GAMM|nr:tetratricopeptide repeat protein [Microbulbifer donghaiensis]SHE94427.1 Tetratricopeptide repeat-containing protein [Microbulbifer donghaiensis]
MRQPLSIARRPATILRLTGLATLLICLFCSAFVAAQQEPPSQELAASGQQKTEQLLQSAIQYRNTNPQKTLQFGALALENLETHPDSAARILVLSNMAWAHMALGQYERGILLAEQAVSIAESLDDSDHLIVPLNISGLLYWRQAEFERALTNFFRALKLTQTLKKTDAEAATLNNIGLIYIEQGDSARAFEYFSRAQKIHRAAGNQGKLTIILNNIAGIYSAQGDYSQALELQLEALKIREDLQDNPGIAELQLNIGITYDHIGDYDKALDYFLEAKHLFESLGDKRAIAQTLNAIGLAYQHQLALTKAQTNYERALRYAREINDKSIECGVLLSLAQLKILQNQPGDAQAFLDRGFRLAKSLGLGALQSQGHLLQAKIYLQRGDSEGATKEAEIAAEMAEASNEKAKSSQAQLLLSQIHAASGDYQQALSAFRHHKKLNDELFSKASSDKLAQLRSLHEAETRLRKIELLERDNAVQASRIEKQKVERNAWISGLVLLLAISLLLYGRFSQRKVNLALQKSLTTQRELMQAIAHEFRAPLARVQLAADMLQEQETSPNTSLFGNINKGLKELDELLREISLWLRRGSPESAEEITQQVDPFKLLQEQAALQHQLHPDKCIDVTPAETAAQKVPLPRKYLVWTINNLLSNAMRYSHNRVEVSCRIQSDRIDIFVDDDGPGIAPADRQRVFEPFVRLDPSRTRATGGTGLGLAIAQRLVESFNGTIAISDSRLGGAQFHLSWPISQPKSI